MGVGMCIGVGTYSNTAAELSLGHSFRQGIEYADSPQQVMDTWPNLEVGTSVDGLLAMKVLPSSRVGFDIIRYKEDQARTVPDGVSAWSKFKPCQDRTPCGLTQ